MAIDCSGCGRPMVVTVDRGVELDHCAGCNTWFFDSGELEAWEGEQRLAWRVVALSVTPAAKPGPACPRCQGATREVASPELAADVCGACHGVLLRRLSHGDAMPSTRVPPKILLPNDDASSPAPRRPPPPPPRRSRSGGGEDAADVVIAGAYVAGSVVDAEPIVDVGMDASEAVGEGLSSAAEASGDLFVGLLEGIGGLLSALIEGLGDAA